MARAMPYRAGIPMPGLVGKRVANISGKGRMDKEQFRRKKAQAAARRESLTMWMLVGLTAATVIAWAAMFMVHY